MNRPRIYILWQTWPWFIPCKVALPFGSLSNLRGVNLFVRNHLFTTKNGPSSNFTFLDIYPLYYFLDEPMLALENLSTSLPPTRGDFQIKKKAVVMWLPLLWLGDKVTLTRGGLLRHSFWEEERGLPVSVQMVI